MVWIYGGGLLNGSASTPLYAGDELARKGVIVVTANYRLGALGFLAHPALTAESAHHTSGNYGLLDQIAALAWVHRNIAAFGGDPGRVTVFGQSSGAISISALTVSPLTRGLFQRAIAESGGLFEPIELDAGYALAGAEASGERFLERSGVASLAALRALPAEDLLKTSFHPHVIVDGHALVEAPAEAYRQGRQNDVDVLVGSNADEGHLFFDGRTNTPATLDHALADDFSGLLVTLIGPAKPRSDEAARQAFVQFEGDMRFGWDMWRWAQLQAASGKGRAFLYRFTRAPPYRRGDKYFGWGASHGMEMPYVFDHLAASDLPWTAADHRLATVISDYWTNFAKTGDPNAAGLPAWPAFTPGAPRAMLLGETIAPGPLPGEAALDRIDRVYAVARWVAALRFDVGVVGGAGGRVGGGVGGSAGGSVGFDFDLPRVALGLEGDIVGGDESALVGVIHGRYFLLEGNTSPYLGAGLGYGGFWNRMNGAGGIGQLLAGVELSRSAHSHLDLGVEATLPFFSVTEHEGGVSRKAYEPLVLLSVRALF